VKRRHQRQEGITLIEMIIVTVILALAASGMTFSLGALSRANLKAAAGKLGAGMRFAYNRAVTQGTTVRVRFRIPSGAFSIEEAHGGVLLASLKDKENKRAMGKDGKPVDAVDPWEAAQARVKQPDKPTMGASPFSPLSTSDGTPQKRYTDVKLGTGVQIVKLSVAHEPEPRTAGEGAVHFFPGGRSEHALIQLGDGRDSVYTVEVRALTGRIKVYPEAHESRDLLSEPDEEEKSEVKEP
jgi:type II secretion system protein H